MTATNLKEAASGEEIVRARLAALPACVREIARSVVAGAPSTGVVVVTGIGASEGPARAMASMLRASWGAAATFVPLSAFATTAASGEAEHPVGRTDSERTLIVFSQGLSPNARLALDCAAEFTRAILFTSVSKLAADEGLTRFEGGGGIVVTLPPHAEHGTLVRVLGPCAAMLAAALYAGAATASDAEALARAVANVAARVPKFPAGARVAFVTAGGYGERCHAARNAWLESLCAPEPPLWDVLQIAHGPFQQFFDAEIVLVALERAGDERALFDRLARMLVPSRHTLVRLESALPSALAPIDHLAQVFELVCQTLHAAPRDLAVWPGFGLDAPLYDLGAESRGVR